MCSGVSECKCSCIYAKPIQTCKMNEIWFSKHFNTEGIRKVNLITTHYSECQQGRVCQSAEDCHVRSMSPFSWGETESKKSREDSLGLGAKTVKQHGHCYAERWLCGHKVIQYLEKGRVHGAHLHSLAMMEQKKLSVGGWDITWKHLASFGDPSRSKKTQICLLLNKW